MHPVMCEVGEVWVCALRSIVPVLSVAIVCEQ